jgi:serine/threonine protein kinase
MGEVYRARDTRLNRDVALKVLPQAFARDPERMARFEREALQKANHLCPVGLGSLGTGEIFQFEVQLAQRAGRL